METSNCKLCNKEFNSYLSAKRKFCSKSCANKVNTTIRQAQKPFGLAVGGYHPKSEFKKDDLRITGKNNHSWKGDNVGYTALHDWIKVRLAKPFGCNHCGKIKVLDLANKSHEYKRDLNDWLWLCKSCHRTYDNSLAKTWITRKLKYGNSGRRAYYGNQK